MHKTVLTVSPKHSASPFGNRASTICSQRSLFTDPRSSTISLKGAGLVGSMTFFSGRFTSWKSGKGLALNLGTWGGKKKKLRWEIKTWQVVSGYYWRWSTPSWEVIPLHFSVLQVFSPSVPCAPAHAPRMRKDTFLHGSSLRVWAGTAHSGAQEVPLLEPGPSAANAHEKREFQEQPMSKKKKS